MTMQNSTQLLAQYTNGGYDVQLYRDGTKVRTKRNGGVPPALPEHMDLKITDWCDAGCAWCHEQSTPQGLHCDVQVTLNVLKPLPAGAEVAIGGGDPLSHPQFEDLVCAMRDQGLVPSVTVNGRHLARHLPVLERLISKDRLFGVGVSYYDRIPSWDYEHMVLHLIAGVNPPKVLDNANRRLKVLLLGYKKFGRGRTLFEVRSDKVQGNLDSWYRELVWVAQEHNLSFDNLAIEQLSPKRLFKDPADYERQYMGPEGQFGMYLDAVTQTFALSSYSAERFAWSDLRGMFAHVRQGQGYATTQGLPVEASR